MRVLWADDQREFVDSVCDSLAVGGFDVTYVEDATAVRSAISTGQYAAILLDLQMPPGQWGGLELLREKVLPLGLPVIVVSGAGTVTQCIEAIRFGAVDYVTKENARDELLPVMQRAVATRETRQAQDDYAVQRETERLLHDLVFGELRRLAAQGNTDLFRSHVPRTVALKSYERWLDAEDATQEQFVDVIDFATIIDHNWNESRAFQELSAVFKITKKAERTKWIEDFNHARRMVAHTVRGDLPSEARAALRHALEIAQHWKQRLQALGIG